MFDIPTIGIPALPEAPALPDGQIPHTPDFPTVPALPAVSGPDGEVLTIPSAFYTVCHGHKPHFRLRTPEIRVKVPAVPPPQAPLSSVPGIGAVLEKGRAVALQAWQFGPEGLGRFEGVYRKLQSKLPQLSGQVRFRCPLAGKTPIHIQE